MCTRNKVNLEQNLNRNSLIRQSTLRSYEVATK